MLKFALIALGGGCGALLRYGVGHLVLRAFGGGSGEPMRASAADPADQPRRVPRVPAGSSRSPGRAPPSPAPRPRFLFVRLSAASPFSTFGHEIADLTRQNAPATPRSTSRSV
ncbi:MAG: hypothetical protein R3F11_27630 [Verrucomicrobiales bacterium]